MNISITEKLNISLSRGSQYYSEWNQKNGLTDYLSLIMYELLIRKRLTQKELAELGDLPKQSINKGIKILKDQDYLELIVDSHDKRVKFCQLTAAGHKFTQFSDRDCNGCMDDYFRSSFCSYWFGLDCNFR